MMTPHQFAALLLRLFALWLLLTAAQIALLTYALQANGQEGGAASYTIAALYLVAALLSGKFPLALAHRILPAQMPGRAVEGNANGAAVVAFIGAGLLIIALKALTPIANYLALLAMLLLSGQSERLLAPNLHVDGMIGLAMLAIGCLLVVNSGPLARAFGPRRQGLSD
jgi:hypothetical protein